MMAAYASKGRKVRRPGNRRRRWTVFLLMAAAAMSAVVAGVITGATAGALRTIPALAGTAPRPSLSSTILDAQDKPITNVYDTENRERVKIDTIPEHVQNAFIAVEDERFWKHYGIDFQGIARALYNDIFNRRLEGGSTITQQLARNAFPIGRERTLRRKVQEAILAIELERRYTKKEILEMYLNHIYFGRDAYGIEVASRTYFGKPAKDLSPAEGALLAGLPQAPNTYEPIGNPEAARRRRNVVLELMAKQGYITADGAAAAKQEPVTTVAAQKSLANPEAHFVDYVLAQMLKKYPPEQVYRGGLKIYTTLDTQTQKAAVDAISRYLDKDFPLGQGKEQPQAALVVLDQQTGEIRAMVGGRSHERMLELNRAWYDPDAGCCARQPGSAFKPVAVYLSALERGFTPASVMEDAQKGYPTPEGEWTAKNFDDTYRGPTSLREAVRRSVNTVAVHTLYAIGERAGYEMAERLGITTLVPRGRTNDHNLSLALGGLTQGVSVLDLTRAYGAIANGGDRIEAPLAIRKVVDAHGNVLEENRPRRVRVVDRRYTYLMVDMLRSVVEPQGAGWIYDAATGRNARVPALDAGGQPIGFWPTAGKTGTTSDSKDVWFVGFTPKYTATVWIGYDNRNRADSLPKSFWGGNQPALIFRDTLSTAHRGLQPVEFYRPEGLVEQEVAINSGKLPGPNTPPAFVRRELFVEGTTPTQIDNTWIRATVCREQPSVLYRESCACTPEERFFPRDPVGGEDLIPFPPEVPRTPVIACGANGGAIAPAPGTTDLGGGEGKEATLRLLVRRTGFDPTTINVRSGTVIHLTAFAMDVEHRITLPELGVDMTLPAGNAATATFTAVREGTYNLRCTRHPDEVARLIVSR